SNWPRRIHGLIVNGPSKPNEVDAYEVALDTGEGDETATASSGVAGENSRRSLIVMLAFAFIGGLILNIMPCVLPVIALKILGFVGEARNDPRRVRNLGMVYTLGVLVSFMVLAGVVIAVKAAGHKAGWGLQFGNTNFLIAL